MIPKVLFLALFSASYVQGQPVSNSELNRPIENHSSVFNNPTAETRQNSDEDNKIVNSSHDVDGEDNSDENRNAGQSENSSTNIYGDGDVSTYHSRPDANKKVTTHREAMNDNANSTPITQRESSSVTEKLSTVKPMTEQRTQKPGVEQFVEIVGQAINDVVKENVRNLDRGVDSVIEVGRSVIDATATILDAKIKLVKSLPRVGEKFFEALGKL